MISTSVTIICDGCPGPCAAITVYVEGLKRARRAAARDGWTSRRRRKENGGMPTFDYCPACSSKLATAAMEVPHA